MKSPQHFPRIQSRPRRSPAHEVWSAYDPYWLEAQSAYGEYAGGFPDDPEFPQILSYPCREEFLMPVDVDEVRDTLQSLPARFLHGMQAIFLLAGTRKQERAACGNLLSYGFYWADCVFLHPFPRTMLRSVFRRAPKPSDLADYARVGAKITTESNGTVVEFNRRSLKRFYLKDVLVHEVGHHVDRENLGHTNENEAYARWFATEYGFRKAGGSVHPDVTALLS